MIFSPRTDHFVKKGAFTKSDILIRFTTMNNMTFRNTSEKYKLQITSHDI